MYVWRLQVVFINISYVKFCLLAAGMPQYERERKQYGFCVSVQSVCMTMMLSASPLPVCDSFRAATFALAMACIACYGLWALRKLGYISGFFIKNCDMLV